MHVCMLVRQPPIDSGCFGGVCRLATGGGLHCVCLQSVNLPAQCACTCNEYCKAATGYGAGAHGSAEVVCSAAVLCCVGLQPVRPMCVNGRRVAREELAVCDLCHDVDGTPVPKWQVNKKQHVKVSLCTPV